MSTDNAQLRVRLTAAQKRAFNKRQLFQLSHRQLANDVDDDDNDHVLTISGGALQRAHKAFKRNAGIRFAEGELIGGDLFKKLGKFAKKAGKYIKKNAGSWVEEGKKLVPKSELKAGLKAGIVAAFASYGMPPPPALLEAADSAVNVTYAHDFRKPLSTLPDAVIDEAASKLMEGQGVGSFFKKAGRTLKKDVLKPVAKAVIENKGVILKTAGATAVAALVPGPLQPAAQLGVNAGINAGLKGGSIRPIGGGSIVPIGGGSIKPIGGSGFVKLAKGSPEAMAWAAKMQAARAAKRGAR